MYTKPICVDLDESLIKNDITSEVFIKLILKKPFLIFKLILLYLKGKSHLKTFIVQQSPVDIKNLPYNEDILNLIKKYRSAGQKSILVTGTHKKIAEQIANYIDLFDEVYATESGTNLVGKSKAKKLVDTFGVKGFDYVGDSKKDLHVWESANKSYLVSKKKNNSLTKSISFEEVFTVNRNSTTTYVLKQMRIHQWVKNLLIIIPIITSLSFTQFELVLPAFLVTALFSLVASSIYILNDIFDLDNDRAHPEKSKRPLASGNLSLNLALFLTTCFLAIAFVGALFINPKVAALFFCYLFVNMIYSNFGKKIPIVDIFFLNFFYMIRIVIGSVTTGIILSNWLLGFAFYFFLSLGMLKRYIGTSKYLPSQEKNGRDYTSDDSIFLFIFGCASSFASTVIMALFINEQIQQTFYTYPNLLWLIFVIINYALIRIWFKAWKKEIVSDPIKYVLKDKVTLGLIVSTLLIVYLSS